ncbi:MAG: hypothetical protein IRZ00_11285 [Gemmatimonadetes bacterium]|nr:hypothetical protein [Gemmatimonadota bacterium]
MRIASLPLLLIPVAACASGAPAALETPPAPPAQVTYTGTTTEVRLSGDNTPVSTVVDAPLDETWRAALSTFAAFGFKPDQLDPSQHQVATQGHRARRTLNGVRLSELFDCGSTITGNVADSHMLRMSVELGVAAAGARSSSVATRVNAVAYPVEGTSTEPMRCGSKGTLEKRILEEIKARAVKR